MTPEESNLYEAKRSLKAHIKFFESLIKHLNGHDKILKGRAMWASWCIHRYLNDGLIDDIEKLMMEAKKEDAH